MGTSNIKKLPDYSGITKGKWEVGYGDNSKALGVYTKEMLDKGLYESPICLISPIDKINDTDIANAAAIASLPNLIKENKRLSGLTYELFEALKQFIHSVEHEGVIAGRVVDAVRNAKEVINKNPI